MPEGRTVNKKNRPTQLAISAIMPRGTSLNVACETNATNYSKNKATLQDSTAGQM